ncbi:MAG: hypothetical protein C4547_13620 [Phycisphaerales bacterium]|nr:MAG: hypothetical protein C4547_13620 [Phycisphaerales bacterium]
MRTHTPGWFERRTGLGALVRALFDPRAAGRPAWRHVWLHLAVYLFALQAVTGLAMMTVYSPSTTAAWGSVWQIQTQTTLGWLVRGLHHFGSQALVVALAIHVLQTLWFAAYRAPMEVAWWICLVMLAVAGASCVTGWLLPWDQRGCWASRVPANIVALTPVVGPALQRLMLGGSEFGQATLTRYHAMHVTVLPASFAGLAAAFIAIRRRLGRVAAGAASATRQRRFDIPQRLRDGIALVIVLGVLLVLICRARSAGDPLLDAPAEPSQMDYPARPEWYFLFLFQWLKLFDGSGMEVIGAIIIPGVIGLVLGLLPFVDRGLRDTGDGARTVRDARGAAEARGGRVIGRVVAGLGACAYLVLLAAAFFADRKPDTATVAAVEARVAAGGELTASDRRVLRARDFHVQKDRAATLARRALELAGRHGIPPAGAGELLARDPVTQGPRLFAGHCSSCHRYAGHDGLGGIPAEPATSSDLAGFGTSAWVRRLLADPGDPERFGRMKKADGEPAHTRMIEWREDIDEEYGGAEAQAELSRNLDAVSAYLAAEGRQPGVGLTIDARAASPPGVESFGRGVPPAADATLRLGREFFTDECNACHGYQGKRTGTRHAPEMYGHGGVDWLVRMISNPADDSLYRSTGREPAQMPSFQERLTQEQIRMIAVWLAGATGSTQNGSEPDP